MITVPAQIFCEPRAAFTAAARSMPGVCGVLLSSRSLLMTLTPSVRQSRTWEFGMMISSNPRTVVNFDNPRKSSEYDVPRQRGERFAVRRRKQGANITRLALRLKIMWRFHGLRGKQPFAKRANYVPGETPLDHLCPPGGRIPDRNTRGAGRRRLDCRRCNRRHRPRPLYAALDQGKQFRICHHQ